MERAVRALRYSDKMMSEFSFANNYAWESMLNLKICFYHDFYIVGFFGGGTLKLTWNNSKSGKFINWLKVAQDLEYLDIISFDEFGLLIKEINKELNWMKHE